MVFSPGVDSDLHRQVQGDRIAVTPFPGDLSVGERLGFDISLIAIDADRGLLTPSRDPQVNRKADRLLCRYLEGDGVAKRIVCYLGNGYRRAFSDFSGHFIRGVKGGAQAMVGRGEPKLLGEIRPAVRDVVLAAAIHFERAVGK